MASSIKYYIMPLPAENGDCIFLSIFDEQGEFNILVDGGTANTYIDYAERPNEERALFCLLKDLLEQGRHIDLLVLSHVDDDHVGGLIEWFNDEFPTNDFVREFWINDDGLQKHSIRISGTTSLKDSVSSTATLIGKLRNQGFCYSNHVHIGVPPIEHRLFTIKVIAPEKKYHDRIAEQIRENLKDSSESVCKTPIKELAQAKWDCSKSTSNNNRASIVFQIDVKNGERLLLMGDGHINDIMDGLKACNPDEKFPMTFKWVKLSHHGNKYNFHPSFFNMVNAENYIVSTDGSSHNHPDKETIARLVNDTSANIYFNYYNTIIAKLFIPQDFLDYHSLDDRLRSCLYDILSNSKCDKFPILVEHLKNCHYDD